MDFSKEKKLEIKEVELTESLSQLSQDLDTSNMGLAPSSMFSRPRKSEEICRKEEKNDIIRNEFLKRFNTNEELKHTIHLKWVFQQILNKRWSIDCRIHASATIDEYLGALLELDGLSDLQNKVELYSHNYLQKGAEWMNKVFEEKTDITSKINNISDVRYRNLFKLLSLFVGENRYYGIAISIIKGMHIKLNYLIDDKLMKNDSLVYNLIFSSSLNEYKDVLYSLNLSDIKSKLKDIFLYWSSFSSNFRITDTYYMFNEYNLKEYLIYRLYCTYSHLFDRLEKYVAINKLNEPLITASLVKKYNIDYLKNYVSIINEYIDYLELNDYNIESSEFYLKYANYGKYKPKTYKSVPLEYRMFNKYN